LHGSPLATRTETPSPVHPPSPRADTGPETVVAYHGTAFVNVASIRREGLRAPAYVSVRREGALLYAAGGDGLGAMVTVSISVEAIRPDASLLFPGLQWVALGGLLPEAITTIECVGIGGESWVLDDIHVLRQ
jgi:hypothetical protein